MVISNQGLTCKIISISDEGEMEHQKSQKSIRDRFLATPIDKRINVVSYLSSSESTG